MKQHFDHVQHRSMHDLAAGEPNIEGSRQRFQGLAHSTEDGCLPASELQQLRSELQRRRLTGKSPLRRRFEQFFKWLR